MSFWDERGLACMPPWYKPGPRYHAYQRIILTPEGKKILDEIEEREKAGVLGHTEAEMATIKLFCDEDIFVHWGPPRREKTLASRSQQAPASEEKP